MSEVVQHPAAVRAKPPDHPHNFAGDALVPGSDTLSGLEQRERYCPACGLYKITLLPTGSRRYRWGHDGDQFQAAIDPPCVPRLLEVDSKP